MLRSNVLFLLLAILAAAIPSVDAKPFKRDTSWMTAAKYGVFVHFLPGGPKWEESVDAFDVDAFARQMNDSGAGYVVFTLGQNSGYYCSPNAAYERYAGYAPNTRCSRRDLPMELSNALSKYGIRLMLYLPSRAPQRDAQAMQGLSDVHEQQPAPQEFTRKWGDVIREWSLRYRKRVSGWWFDGSYNRAGWDDLSKPYNWSTWAAACRAGNPDSLLAFNPGTDRARAFSRLTAEQDYTAGEQNDWTATPREYPAPEGMAWQVLGFLGTQWSKADGPRLANDEMVEYVRTVNSQGGAVTMDVATSGGKVYPPHLDQLIALRRALQPATDGK